MKVTREKVAENREKLVRTASRLFRERGVDGVGVAEISHQAGLTHGALYAQFGSKDALVAEALADALSRAQAQLEESDKRGVLTLESYVNYYLSPKQRDDLGGSCPMAASASEIARQVEAVSSCFAQGFGQMVGTVQALLPNASLQSSPRERAIAMSAAMIGALAIARGAAKSRPAFSDEILAAVASVVAEMGAANTKASRRKKSDRFRPAV